MQPDENNLVFPKRADTARLDKYVHHDKIYFGDHYGAYSIKGQQGFNTQYSRLRYIAANFGGLMSRVMADMLFGETITIDAKDAQAQKFVDGFFENNQLFNQLYESALANSRRGDACFKLRIAPRKEGGPSDIIAEEFSPELYFPGLSAEMPRNQPKEDVIAICFRQDGKDYLRKEIHTPGFIHQEIYLYSPNEKKIIAQVNVEDFGFKEVEETGVDRSLVFHIPNVRDGSGFYGTSDYQDLDPLFFALNNRITKIDNILDKHSDPILAVPPGVIDEEGKVKKEALGMFEVDNENPGFNKPEYIVWNANLESAFTQIDKIIAMLFMFSEISPASVGKEDDGGQAESGRALKFKLLATIRKRNRKMRYYDQFIKDFVETAQELAKANRIAIDGVTPTTIIRPTIKWGDGVINDETEMVENTNARIESGTMSRADAIAQLDNVSPDEAEEKVKQIDEEAAPVLPASMTTTPAAPTGPQPPANTTAQSTTGS